jgi:hypothetical protein
MEKTAFNTDELSVYSGIPKRKLRYWRAKGWGPAYSVLSARTVVYLKSDIDAFLAAGRVEPRVVA